MILPTFYIDSRETKSRVPEYIEWYIPEALERLHWHDTVPILRKKLDWGDYAWLDVNNRIIAFERKTYTDLLSSMNETAQAKMLRERGFEVAPKKIHKVTRQLYLGVQAGATMFLLLEGVPWLDDAGKLLGRRSISSVKEMLRRYSLEGIHFLFTDNPQDTAKELVDTYMMCQRRSETWP